MNTRDNSGKGLGATALPQQTGSFRVPLFYCPVVCGATRYVPVPLAGSMGQQVPDALHAASHGSKPDAEDRTTDTTQGLGA